MKSFIFALLVCLLVLGLVAAVPVDESIAGDLYGSEDVHPQEANSFFKLKKIKKLLLG